MDSLKEINEDDLSKEMSHKDAIIYVANKLEKEFKERPQIETKIRKGFVPDIIIRKRIKDKLLVIEVGYTKAEKIMAYLQMPDVGEVRWYAKTGKKIGTWKKTGTNKTNGSKGTIQEEVSKKYAELQHTLTSINYYTEKLKSLFSKVENLDYHWDRTYVNCPYCHKAHKIENVELTTYGGYYILACKSCIHETI